MHEMKQRFCIKLDWRFDTLTISLGVSAEVTCLGQKTSYVQDLRKFLIIGKSTVVFWCYKLWIVEFWMLLMGYKL